jgi:hypothetical protein
MRIVRGPFRGAVVVMVPRNSMRKVLGLYERELNQWLERTLPRVNRVLDVGANDGYFTFGCAAAFQRLGKAGEIIAFEPQDQHIVTLRRSLEQQPGRTSYVTLLQIRVDRDLRPGATILDAVRWQRGKLEDRTNTLVKIDVEGAELDVLRGASSWLDPTNHFLIEVHRAEFLTSIPELFASHGLRLKQINQKPLVILGGEMRNKTNWWLVSDRSDFSGAK